MKLFKYLFYGKNEQDVKNFMPLEPPEKESPEIINQEIENQQADNESDAIAYGVPCYEYFVVLIDFEKGFGVHSGTYRLPFKVVDGESCAKLQDYFLEKYPRAAIINFKLLGGDNEAS